MTESSIAKPIVIGLGVTALAALASRIAPAEHAANIVAAIFVGATYFLVLNKSFTIAANHGMRFGGMFEPQPLSAARIARELATALGWALVLALLSFPAFWLGYRSWFGVDAEFEFALPEGFLDLALAQLLVIALPEEMFYRGYLQSQLAAKEVRTVTVFGAKLGASVLLSSAIFALGHLLATPNASRLAVFFPSLLFGWLRSRTGGIGSSVVYHALCNLFSATLAHGYGLD
jgi:uncharacterized protein